MFFVRSLTVVFTAALFLSTQAWKNEDEVVTVTKTNTHYVCPCITDTPLTPSPDSHEWTEWEGDHSASGSGWVTSPTGKDTKTPKGPTGSGTTSPTPGDHHHTWPTSKPGSVPTSSGTWTTTKRSRRPTSGTSSSTSSKTKSTTVSVSTTTKKSTSSASTPTSSSTKTTSSVSTTTTKSTSTSSVSTTSTKSTSTSSVSTTSTKSTSTSSVSTTSTKSTSTSTVSTTSTKSTSTSTVSTTSTKSTSTSTVSTTSTKSTTSTLTTTTTKSTTTSATTTTTQTTTTINPTTTAPPTTTTTTTTTSTTTTSTTTTADNCPTGVSFLLQNSVDLNFATLDSNQDIGFLVDFDTLDPTAASQFSFDELDDGTCALTSAQLPGYASVVIDYNGEFVEFHYVYLADTSPPEGITYTPLNCVITPLSQLACNVQDQDVLQLFGPYLSIGATLGGDAATFTLIPVGL